MGGSGTVTHEVLFTILKKTMSLFLTVMVILGILFSAFYLKAGSPYFTFVPKSGNEELRLAIAEDYHVNEPMINQFWYYVTDTLSGDFRLGIHIWPGHEISGGIWDKAMVTSLLFLSVLALAIFLGITAEWWIRQARRNILSNAIHLCSLMAFSIPAFGLGLILIGLNNDLDIGLPFSGNGSERIDQDASVIDTAWSVLKHAILPFLTCLITATGSFAILARSGSRSGMEEHGQMQVRQAEGSWRAVARGMSEMRPFRHFFVAWTMGIVILAEVVFAYDGLGSLAWRAIIEIDNGVLMATAFLITIIVLAANIMIGGLFALAGIVKPGHYLSGWGNSSNPHKTASHTPIIAEVNGLKSTLDSFRRSRSGMIALGILVIMIAMGILAPIISTVPEPNKMENYEPNNVADNWVNPLPPSIEPSPYTDYLHPFGTNSFGQDEYSMFLYETRTAVYALFEFIFISLIIGIMIAWVASRTVDLRKNISKTIDFIMTAVSRAFVTIPMILLIIVYFMTREIYDSPSPTYILAIYIVALFFIWSGFIILRSVRERTRSRKEMMRSYDSPRLNELLGFAAESISVIKYGAVISIMTLLAVDAFIGLSLDLTWGNSLASSQEFSASLRGQWNLILPPIAGAFILSISIFIVLDQLEASIISRHPRPIPTDVPEPSEIPTIAEDVSVSNPNGAAVSDTDVKEPTFGNI